MHPYPDPVKEPRKHHSSDKVLEGFEKTRSQHGGLIADAAPLLGMSEAALQRCLYRARKQGRDIYFTTSRKKAQYELHDAVSDAHEAVEETVDAANTYAQNLHI